jgi:Tfp pilus tip-associated adhesin PilY1
VSNSALLPPPFRSAFLTVILTSWCWLSCHHSWNGNTGACQAQPSIPGGDSAGYDCSTPWYMGPGIHPRLKKPVGQRLALGALQVAYKKGNGAVAGVIGGCSASASALTLKFNMAAGRTLSVRKYNASNPVASATSVRVKSATTSDINGATDDGEIWLPVHIKLGSAPGTVEVDLSSLPAGSGAPTAVRYAWGGPTAPNGAPGPVICSVVELCDRCSLLAL